MAEQETPATPDQPSTPTPAGGQTPSAPAPGLDPKAMAALKAAQDAIAMAKSGVPPAAPEEEPAPQPAAAPARPAPGPAVVTGNGAHPPPAGAAAERVALTDLQPSSARQAPSELDLLSDVNLNVKIELGRTRMLVEDVLRLAEGSVVELDKLAGDPVDIYVNDRHVARGEVLVVNENFCVRISEILDGPQGPVKE